MKRLFLVPFLLTLLFGAASAAKLPPAVQALNKAVEQAGGQSKYLHLETLTCGFEETVFTDSGTVVLRGHRAFRLHDGAGLRAREDAQTPAGTRVTVVTSSGAWVTLDGKPVAGDGGGLLAEFFWITAPQRVLESGNPVQPLSEFRFMSHLVDRISVGGPPLFPGGDGLALCLHKETGQMDGAQFGDLTVYFHTYETTKGFLVVPIMRADVRDGRKIRLVKLSDIAVNTFVDEALFQPPSQGVHP